MTVPRCLGAASEVIIVFFTQGSCTLPGDLSWNFYCEQNFYERLLGSTSELCSVMTAVWIDKVQEGVLHIRFCWVVKEYASTNIQNGVDLKFFPNLREWSMEQQLVLQLGLCCWQHHGRRSFLIKWISLAPLPRWGASIAEERFLWFQHNRTPQKPAGLPTFGPVGRMLRDHVIVCAQNCTNQSWFPHVSTVYSVLCKIFTHFFHPRDFRLSLSTGPGSRTTSLGATPQRGWDGFFPDLGMGQGIQGVQGMKIHQFEAIPGASDALVHQGFDSPWMDYLRILCKLIATWSLGQSEKLGEPAQVYSSPRKITLVWAPIASRFANLLGIKREFLIARVSFSWDVSDLFVWK